jgi:ethanolamine utilization microcompartment shell protein EutL
MPIDRNGNYVPVKTTEVFNTDIAQLSAINKNVIKENAASQGLTAQEYLLSRGGVNPVTGKYGDSFNPQLDLSDAEYRAAISGKTGVAQGQAINAAQQAKQQAFYASSGTGYQAPDGTWYASAMDARQAGAIGGAGVGTGGSGAVTPAGRTLASDTFVNTFALVFGKTEAAQPYVKQLYTIVSGFYKSGSSIDESLNLAIRQARQDKSIPEFTKRFTGLFALEDKFNAGFAVEVPTIAEFFAAEAKMGDILNQAGLGDLATQEFLGNVIGQGKSVATVANLISDAFNTIDTAPTALRETLNTYFPNVDRTSLAKAILTGEQGAKALSDKIKGISVLSAAGTQGVSGIGLDYAQNLANMGIDYQEALTGFAQVKNLERGNTLAQFGGGTFTSGQAQKAVFEKNVEEQNRLDLLKELERGRFQGDAGTNKSSFTSGTLGQI